MIRVSWIQRLWTEKLWHVLKINTAVLSGENFRRNRLVKLSLFICSLLLLLKMVFTLTTTNSWSATLWNMWDAVTQGIRNSTFIEEMKNMSAPSFSNDPVGEVISPAHLLISRGCKSKDLLQGSMLQSSSGNSGKVYTQLCSSNLCNFGDGRESFPYINWINHFITSFNFLSKKKFRIRLLRVRRGWNQSFLHEQPFQSV